MFNLFRLSCIFFSVVTTAYAMEVVVSSQDRVPSLKVLSVRAVVNHMVTHEELEKFARGNTKYHPLPEDLEDIVAKELPDISPRINSCFEGMGFFSEVEFHPTAPLCLVAHDGNQVSLVNIDTGVKLHIYDGGHVGENEYIRMSCSADWEHFLVKHQTGFQLRCCMGSFAHDGIKDYGHCFDAYFAPTGKEIVVRTMEGFTVFDIVSDKIVYQCARALDYSSLKPYFLIMQKNDTAARLIDSHSKEELRVFPLTNRAALSPDGTLLFREFDSWRNSELIDLVSDVSYSMTSPLVDCHDRLTRPVFSNNSRYLLIVTVDHGALYDCSLKSTMCCAKISLSKGDTASFALNGEYLLFSRLSDRDSKLIKISDIIAEYTVQKQLRKLSGERIDEKYYVSLQQSVDQWTKPIVVRSRDKLFSYLNKNYLLEDRSYSVNSTYPTGIDLLDKLGLLEDMLYSASNTHHNSVVLKGIEEQDIILRFQEGVKCFVHPRGNMILVSLLERCVTTHEMIRLKSDLTTGQFLLKLLIMMSKKTIKQIEDDVYLSVIYKTLSAGQKAYFDAYIAEHLNQQ